MVKETALKEHRQSSSMRRTWEQVAPLPISMASAGIAIVPIYYGLVGKTTLQLGGNVPKMGLKEAIKGGVGLSPLIGAIVGVQMTAQKAIEIGMLDGMHVHKKDDVKTMLAASAVVGAVTSPIDAVLNGKTMGQTPMQSLRNLNRWQVGAVSARETIFVMSLRAAQPVGRYMKETFGDKPWVENASAFISGAIGSVIGHPTDTAFTLWQKNRKIESLPALMRGSMVKAVSIGVFASVYHASRRSLERLNQAALS